MRDVTFTCSIDGQRYYSEHLAQIEHQRHLHVLHEMKRLGVALSDDGLSLSHDSINVLSAPDARRISAGVRASLSVAAITDLFDVQLRASDQMWKDAYTNSRGTTPQPCLVDVTVTGLTADELGAYFAGAHAVGTGYIDLNPDHYLLSRTTTGMQCIETFGMFGGPTSVQLVSDPDVEVPVAAEHDYSLLAAGRTILASDGTDLKMYARHQIKTLDNGLTLKLGAFFPSATPKAIIDGHRVHMAIEFWQLCAQIAEPPRGSPL